MLSGRHLEMWLKTSDWITKHDLQWPHLVHMSLNVAHYIYTS